MSLGQIKQALQTLYTGTATVYTYGYVTDERGAEVMSEEATEALTDIPCRLSYDRKENNEQNTVGTIVQDITMHCDPSYDIPAGSKIVITQNGVTRTYKCSSKPAVYESHQEVELTAYRERA